VAILSLLPSVTKGFERSNKLDIREFFKESFGQEMSGCRPGLHVSRTTRKETELCEKQTKKHKETCLRNLLIET